MRLSCIIPVYNEKDTILKVVERVLNTRIVDEIIIVDDASTDGTTSLLKGHDFDDRVRTIYHDRNSGKGRAVRTGFASATGDIVVVQDADMEYNPEDFKQLVKPIIEGRADIVYGSRMAKGERFKSGIFMLLKLGNSFITWFANALYGSNLTDLETCYKMFKRDLLDGMPLNSCGFDIEPELTAKFLKRKIKIEEIPISYHGRSYREGKKIFWWHGFEAIWALLKYRFTD